MFYDGTKLLSLKDINGNQPEIYMCTSNRNAGKTTYFLRMLFNRFLKNQSKFYIQYRYNDELDQVAEKVFTDIGKLFFPKYGLRGEKRAKKFVELFLYEPAIPDDKGVSCGYAVSLNSAESIKKYSHFFSECQSGFMDEFQSETNTYCPKEIEKFMSIHTSIARGGGKQVRYLPVYMCANAVSLINPYFTAMGISSRLQSNTKFLRGTGYVLEHSFNESASKAQEESGFMQAFSSHKYAAYASQNVYLNDNISFIEKPTGRNRYLGTLVYKSKKYALREFPDLGVVYCDDRVDTTYRFQISVTTDDHNINYVMLKNNSLFISNIRFLFDKGCLRFKNLDCKDCVMALLSY